MLGRWCFSGLKAAILLALLGGGMVAVHAEEVPIKALGRFDGWRDNALIGYGIVTGLSGSGDTRRNAITRQALRNVLLRLGTTISEDELNSRNAAVVVVTATLPASANVGDRLDAVVSSIGDARSLAGGTLLMTPLLGPDRQPYALAQGALVVGGYNFDANLNAQQRNYPATGILQGGATVEQAVDADILSAGGEIGFLLAQPSYSTADRIAQAINQRFGSGTALVRNADEVRIRFAGARSQLAGFVAGLENLAVHPDRVPRVVINERTGTIVAGGDVTISSVVISQGDIKVTVTTDNEASQPSFISGFANDVASLVVTNTTLEVDQGSADAVVSFPSTTVVDLFQGLARAKVDTRRTIGILQAIKAAGALHADIVVQ